MNLGLAFSGGKDSMACLWLLKEGGQLDDTTVIWVNTGKNYPELLVTIAQARLLCKKFVEIRTDQAEQNRRCGLPSDVVPVNATAIGMLVTSQKPQMIQSYLQCCAENISQPLMAKAKELGITHLVRGQRLDESHKSPARNGDIVDGVTFLQPIETWSTEDVMTYLRKVLGGGTPYHFGLKHSSMDCYDCTAYAADTKDRVEYTKNNHPTMHKEYLRRREALREALTEGLADMGAETKWETE